MPSHSPKQAKTMSAIAHGWKPTGEAADIPVGVAKEFHAADKGKKYGKGGKKGYDRSGHFPGNPGFHREGKPPYGKYDAGAHAKQPHGKSIGAAPEHAKHRANQSFEAEVKEHNSGGKHGAVANIAAKGGSTMGHRGEVANVDKPEGSHLLEQDNDRHAKQHKGDGVGVAMHKSDGKGGAEHHKGSTMAHGSPYVFRAPPATNAHGYGHSGGQRKGHLRMSGHSGAHMIGCKK